MEIDRFNGEYKNFRESFKGRFNESVMGWRQAELSGLKRCKGPEACVKDSLSPCFENRIRVVQTFAEQSSNTSASGTGEMSHVAFAHRFTKLGNMLLNRTAA
jgi:hypothetical protein